MDFNQQITILKQNRRTLGSLRDSNVRFVTSEKWRGIMLRCLQKMKKKETYDNNLLDDLGLIVQSINEQKFIQAILNIQPFKPKFQVKYRKQIHEKLSKQNIENVEEADLLKTRTKLVHDERMEFRGSIIKFKQSVHEKINDSLHELKNEKHKRSLLEEMISMVTEEVTLTKQFEAKYHPYRKIIEQFLYLIENKYKNSIESQKFIEIEKIQQSLIYDLKLLQEFIVKSSEPYLAIFKSDSNDEREMFQVKLVAFIKQYLEKHEKINLVIRKIMRMAVRKTNLILKLTKHISDFVEIQNFAIKQIYKIDGCYLHSMNALMEFAEALSSKVSLKKLKELRMSLGKDVDDYYNGHTAAPAGREICTQTQLQILKFIVAKLKYFLSEIYAQLKYLQVVFGEDEMSFKYDDSSYMYAQISVAIEALELDCA